MSRFTRTLVVVMSLVMLLAIVGGVRAQSKTIVTWFVGLGTGGQAEQIEVQNKVVADFNASQDEILLVLNIVPYASGRDTLSTLIAAGTSPDIVGPVGVGGSNAFTDQWADLTGLVESSGYDLSVFDPALLDLYRTADGQLVGIPFAVFPSMTYYNRGLFDEAGLNYPPQTFDTKYVMADGSEVDWNYDTIAALAKILTVDANGNDATSADFDPDSIVQFGFNFQWAELRLMWTDFQPEDWYDEATNKVTIPDSWRKGTQWIQDAVWKDHFFPNATYDASELLASSNAFSSGKLAMAVTPLWYTCCLANSVGNFEWDLAVVPQSLDGKYHVATDADTFRLTKGSANPEAAFKVLSYLLDEAVPALAGAYGAYPARPAAQGPYIEGRKATFDWGINWDVPVASLAYNNPGNQHHESNLPNWQKVRDRTQAFSTLLFGDTGGDVDVNAELDTVLADVQAIVDEK
jgi:multiple sugar transport system substrate-binding protein